MATFSTNQVRQLYVANALTANAIVPASDAVGTIKVNGDTAKTHLYFQYLGKGGLVRSDLIETKNILYVKASDADSMKRPLKKQKVVIDANPIAGQDYILRVLFSQFIGITEEDKYVKYGAVRATTGMTKEAFYKTLLTSLEKNFSREEEQLLSFSLVGTQASAVMSTNTGITVKAKDFGSVGNKLKFAVASVSADTAKVVVSTAAGITTITASLTAATATIAGLKALIDEDAAASALVSIAGVDATAVSAEAVAVALTGGDTTGLVAEEVAQDWILGRKEQVAVHFELQPTTIISSDLEVIWGTVTKEAPTTYVINGKQVADLEFFLAGEKGDIYRGVGYPNVINTEYLVDSAKAYNFIDIHYAYVGSGEGVQKSEKTISIAVPKVGATNSVSNDLVNDIVDAIEAATGLTIAGLDVSA